MMEDSADLSSFRLHVVTWNVATYDPPEDEEEKNKYVTSLLHLDSPQKADLYVIGLQEVYAAIHRFCSDMMFDDRWSLMFTSILEELHYVKVESMRMQGLLLLVFAKEEHVRFIKDHQATYTRTGIFGCWGNKGCVSMRLSFYGHTLCFLNCHLAAHMDFVAQRVDEFKYIVNRQRFDCKKAPKITDHRLVFWLGDLNFRIDRELNRSAVLSYVNQQKYEELWNNEQLIKMKKQEVILLEKNGKCKKKFLKDFEEGSLNFQPTFKFDRNSDTYDTSHKKRKPAWTDRILWRIRPDVAPREDQDEDSPCLDAEKLKQHREEEEFPLRVKQELYTNIMQFTISDHKPVIAIFTLELKEIPDKPTTRNQGAEET